VGPVGGAFARALVVLADRGVTGHAARIVAAARRRDELPATMAAFDAGALSLDQVTPIVDHAPGWADAEVADLARRCTVGQMRAASPLPLRRHRRPTPVTTRTPRPGSDVVPVVSRSTGTTTATVTADPHPDDPTPPQPPPDEFFRFVDDGTGTWRATGRFDADHGW
jgi:hypothetical protein